MRKLHMVAMSYDKDTVLNALQRTGAVEVALHKDTALTCVPQVETEALKTYATSVDTAISTLTLAVDNYEKDNGMKSTAIKDGFDVSYSEFTSIYEKKAEIDKTVEEILSITEKKNHARAEMAKVNKEKDEISNDTIDNLIKVLNKDLLIVRKYAKNSLLKPAKKLVPIINKIIRTLVEYNVELIQMSGSGSTVYGIDKDVNKLKKIYETIKDDYEFVGIYETM